MESGAGPDIAILIVEDDPFIVRVLNRSFSKLSVTVRCEPDAATAQSALEARRFDVVWSDLNLGFGGDGVDVMNRAHSMNPGALLIIVTGNADMIAGRKLPEGVTVFSKSEVERAVACVRERVEQVRRLAAK